MILKQYNIIVAAHILAIKDIKDDSFDMNTNESSLNDLLNKSFPVLNNHCEELMKDKIREAKEHKDSIGGIIECMIYNVPVGLGKPFFDSLESQISHLMFSIPSIKSIVFGDDMTTMYGSEANDAYYYDNDTVKMKTNHNGGILGGLSTGMPIVFKVGVKPTPSIALKQETINIETKENTYIELKGRHDPCIVPRVNVVVESMAALAILDMMEIK